MINEQNSKQPRIFSAGKAVKQMVYPDGRVENLGCTQQTPWCTEGPHWDTSRNLRINNAPCCERATLRVLEVLTRELQRVGIPHMVFGGGGYVDVWPRTVALSTPQV